MGTYGFLMRYGTGINWSEFHAPDRTHILVYNPSAALTQLTSHRLQEIYNLIL